MIGSHGGYIGKVTGLNFDLGTWQISTVDVALDSKVAEETGIKKTLQRVGIKHTEIPLKASFVEQVGDKIILNTSKDEIAKYAKEVQIDEFTKKIHVPEGTESVKSN